MFKLSLRTLVRYRLYSIINLLGLALSLTCAVIIVRYVLLTPDVIEHACVSNKSKIVNLKS